MLLQRGSVGPEVVELRRMLERVGWPVPPPEDHFGPRTDCAVREFQEKYGLKVDGKVEVGGTQTWAKLKSLIKDMDAAMPNDAIDTYREVIKLPCRMPVTEADKRISGSIVFTQTCDNGQGCVYGGWINPWQFDGKKFQDGKKFTIPKVGKIVPGAKVVKPCHGGTCSPYAGFWDSWLMCANEDYTRILAWNGAFLVDCPTTGEKVHNGDSVGFCRGFEEYVEVHGKRKLESLPLNVMYGAWEWMRQINIVLYSNHIMFCLKVGGPDGLNLEDPKNLGKPLPSGLYLYGAGGFYPKEGGVIYYSGTKQTLRRLGETEKVPKPWDFWRQDDLDPDGACPRTGRYAGRTPWPLVLE